MSARNLQIRLREVPAGLPEASHFEAATAAMPTAGPAEVLCRNLWLSLDPYMRSQMAGRHPSGTVAKGDLLMGETVAEVVQSNCDRYAPGQLVRGFGHWQRYAVLKGAQLTPLPEPLSTAPQRALGCLGMPGLTAWAGLTQHAQLRTGDRLLLPAATGAVGSVAAGIARHLGAHVLAVVGSEQKRQYATQQLHCDLCINRKTSPLAASLDAACPQGIDVYFDLVGGELLQLAADRLKPGGRIVLCGLMAEYNSPDRSPGPTPGQILRARARVSGLVVYDYEHRREEFIRYCLPLIEQGLILPNEDITDGLTKAPEAFCRLMRGQNFGKALVRV